MSMTEQQEKEFPYALTAAELYAVVKALEGLGGAYGNSVPLDGEITLRSDMGRRFGKIVYDTKTDRHKFVAEYGVHRIDQS